MEIINIPEDVRAAMYKVASINLCSNVNGQICTAMVMNPPKVSRPFQPIPRTHYTRSFTSVTRSLYRSLTHSLIQSLIPSFISSFVQSFIRQI